MKYELKTRLHTTRSGELRFVVDILLLPRGSGNRSRARALAAEARKSALAPHLTRVVVGTSRITLHLRSSLELMKIISTWPTPTEDVPGQLMLPGIAV